MWAFLVWERIGIARGIDTDGVAQDANFTMNGSAALGEALTPGAMIESGLIVSFGWLNGPLSLKVMPSRPRSRPLPSKTPINGNSPKIRFKP
ncbi:hypothetical protein D3C87_1984140 [compost metagenome]